MSVRHISFDVWNTLVSPNPAFSEARDALLSKAYGSSPERVRWVYKSLKNTLDMAAEQVGVARDTSKCFAILAEMFGHGAYAAEIQVDMEKLVEKHPPLAHDEIVVALRMMTRKSPVTLSIGSNTNFISGHLLSRLVLDTWDVPWAFKVFSDEQGVSKPNPSFFDAIATKVASLNPQITRHSIAHLGDNPVCDVQGAHEAGFTPIHVANPSLVPKALQHYR
jgi:putative hydrolase of the HAD superfamily